MVRLKENHVHNGLGRRPIFQFLMVRLKVSLPLSKDKRFKSISIPYGAIKSIVNGKNNYIYSGFQFLMVRLKGMGSIKTRSTLPDFNSLWCD